MRSSVVAARREVSLLVASRARTRVRTAAGWAAARMCSARVDSAARKRSIVRWVSGCWIQASSWSNLTACLASTWKIVSAGLR